MIITTSSPSADNGIDTAEVVVDCPADVYCSGDTAAENDGASLLEKKDSKKSCGGGGQMATVKYSTEEEDTRVQVEYQQQGAKSPPKATSPTTSAAAATVVPEHLQVVTVSVADELPAKRHFLGRALNIQNSVLSSSLPPFIITPFDLCSRVLLFFFFFFSFVDRLLLLFFLSPS